MQNVEHYRHLKDVNVKNLIYMAFNFITVKENIYEIGRNFCFCS